MSVSHPFSSCFFSLQVFRTDLITAMKLPDSYQLNADEYYVLADPWRQEWEKGVQVPVSPETIPEPVARYTLVKPSVTWGKPLISCGLELVELHFGGFY